MLRRTTGRCQPHVVLTPRRIRRPLQPSRALHWGHRLAIVFLLAAGSAWSATLLDDTWADGTRNNQNLPSDSAWFASTGSLLTASPNAMTLAVGSGAVLALTYFTPDAAVPASLDIGDSLELTARMTFTGVAAPNSSQGFRLALVNVADSTLSPTRVSADGFSNSSQGNGVNGYALFQNMGTTFNNSNPIEIRKRIPAGSASLLGSSGDWIALGSGPGTLGAFTGFSDGVPYELHFKVQRPSAEALAISVTWSNTVSGTAISASATDAAAANFSFDGIGLRPLGSSSTATAITFSRVTVRLVSGSDPPSIDLHPESQTVRVGDDVMFEAAASGTPPLEYQWFFNTGTPLAGAASPTLFLTNVQAANEGAYSIVVSNSLGAATSSVAWLTVVVPATTNTAGEVLSVQPAGGAADVLFAGVSGNEYDVLRSTNLIHWTVLMTTNPPLAGWFRIVDDFSDLGIVPSRAFYRLRLATPACIAPEITTEPEDQTVTEGGSTTFSVAADGRAPLSYQWYFNTDTLLAGANSSSLVITNAQAQDAGGYFVVITNTVGAVTSRVATLTVTPVSTNPPGFELVGFATMNGGTTGGSAGPTVTVTNFAEFDFYARQQAGPYVIQVDGTINLGTSNARVRSNKTIVGLGTNATFIGNLKAFRETNIVIRNITFTNPNKVGDGDGITLDDAQNVWIDHCTFVDCGDGSLDITHGSDWVTVSWCKFYYTFNSGHNFVNLVGHSDSSSAEAEDAGRLHVTFHHNWYSTLCVERMPRVRFGRVHVFNNYFASPGNNYCIRAARDSEVLIENNHFDNVKNVWELYVTTGTPGKILAINNIEVNTTWFTSDSNSMQVPGTDPVFAPPYAYSADAAAQVPSLVTNYAGAGRLPFE